MSVRIPGGGSEVGHQLASRLEADLSPDGLGAAGHLDRLDLEVRVPADASPAQVSRAIVQAIRRRIS